MTNPIGIDPSDVANLYKSQFTRLLTHLLHEEASLYSIPPDQVETSLRDDDTDGGLDARVRNDSASTRSRWLPRGISIWQFKSGKVPPKKEIISELNKPVVRAAIGAGATYCLALAADLKPKRRDVVKDIALAAAQGIRPDAEVKLLCAGNLAEWCNEHPSSFWLFDRPVVGVESVDDWLASQPVHQVPFIPDRTREQFIQDLRLRLAEPDGFFHLRIQGPRGVGKSRLALEACRAQTMSVLYAPEPPSIEFFSWMARRPRFHATLIIDECSMEDAERCSNWARMSQGRLSILTVGHTTGVSADPDVFTLEPLDDRTMLAVVLAVAPDLPAEQVRWVLRVAHGYVKLATAITWQMARGISTVTDLTSTSDVSTILKRLLPDPSNQRAMRGMALLQRVGWDDDVEGEGKWVAEFVGLTWSHLQEIIGQIARVGLISKVGRYRVVTPEILALWLAVDEWRGRKDKLIQVLRREPSPELRDGLLDRLISIVGLDDVADVIEHLMSPAGPFRTADVLRSGQTVKLFRKMAYWHPRPTLSLIERWLRTIQWDTFASSFSQSDHMAIPGIVWCAALRKETFARAARMLLAIACQQTRRWNTDAIGFFPELFLTFHSGMETSAIERYAVIEEALRGEMAKSKELGMAAIHRALTVTEHPHEGLGFAEGFSSVDRWQPRTFGEELDSRRAALRLLDLACSDEDENIAELARRRFLDVAEGLVTRGVVEDVVIRLERWQVHNEEEQHDLWSLATRILTNRWIMLTEDMRERIERLRESLFGSNLHDKLHLYLGTPLHDLRGISESDLRAVIAHLADELYDHLDILQTELEWLSSSEREGIVPFGRRLGELDDRRTLINGLVQAVKTSSGDTRLLTSYLQARRDAGDGEWCEQLLDEWMRFPEYAVIVLIATWQGPASEHGVQRLIKLVDHNMVRPVDLSRLRYGRWVCTLSPESLSAIIRRVMRGKYEGERETDTRSGISMLREWLDEHKWELPSELEALAWDLIEQHAMSRNIGHDDEWVEIAMILMDRDPVRLAQITLRDIVAGHESIDRRFFMFSKAIERDPLGIWKLFSGELDSPEHRWTPAWEWPWERFVFDHLDAELILSWARQRPATRPVQLARLIKPSANLSALVRGLIAEYGPNGQPGQILRGNFDSGVTEGTLGERFELQLHIAQSWLLDSDAAAQTWAQGVVDELQQRLPRLKMLEEEWLE